MRHIVRCVCVTIRGTWAGGGGGVVTGVVLQQLVHADVPDFDGAVCAGGRDTRTTRMERHCVHKSNDMSRNQDSISAKLLYLCLVRLNVKDDQTVIPCRVGSVGSVSASRTVGREFASRPGHTKDHHKNGTNCLPA